MLIFAAALFLSAFIFSSTIKPGTLKTINSEKVLFLKGSPYERGYQHGKALKEQIKQNLLFIERLNIGKHPRFAYFAKHLDALISHIPQKIIEELQGLSDGSGFDIVQLSTQKVDYRFSKR